REAVARDPDQPYHQLLLGQVCAQQRQLDEAIRACERAVALDPQLAAAHAQLGQALAMSQRYAEALPHLRRALELNPDDWGARTTLATTYRALGRQADAAKEFALVRAHQQSEATLKVYRKRTELQPRSGDAWYELGRACLAAGQQRDA